MDKDKLLGSFRGMSGFYNKKLSGVSSFSDASATTKAELLESQMQYPPFGDFTNDSKPVFQIYRTSGTTTHPLWLTFTKNDIELITDIGRDCLFFAGMGRSGNNEIVINCLNLSMWSGGFLDSQSIMKTGVQTINFGAGNTLGLINLIKSLIQDKKYKVSLHCTPSYLAIIEKRLSADFGITPGELNINTFYLGGESGIENNTFRENLKSIWHAEIINANYGLSEVCSAMASANDENILRFAPSFLEKYIIELKLENDNIIGSESISEGDEGELLITSLEKESQPLFRYNTKEIIRIVRSRGNELFFGLTGRSDDMIVYKGINIFPEQFRDIVSRFRELTGRYQLQIKKEGSMISEIKLVCEKSKAPVPDEPLFKNKLGAVILSELSIHPAIVLVDKLDLSGNKLKLLEFI
jgi:phenylacetate-CoA ligase